jgi:hypothetical protein
MNEGKGNVESEDENVPVDNTEDQEGKCKSEAERNKMQVAVENEFYESVHVEAVKIVVHEGNYITGADVINVQEPVETEFHEDIHDVSENVHRNENDGVEIRVSQKICNWRVKNIMEEIIELNFIQMKTTDLLTEVKVLVIYFQKP